MTGSANVQPVTERRLAGLGWGLYFFGFVSLAGWRGPATEALRLLEAGIALGAAILVAAPGGAVPRVAAAGLLTLGLASLPTDLARLLVYALAGLGLATRQPRFARAVALLFALNVVPEALPGLRRYLDLASGAVGRTLLVSPPGESLGLIAHGGLLVLSAWVFCAVCGRSRGARFLFGLAAAGLWAAQYRISAGLLRYVGPYWTHGHPPSTFDNLPVLAVLLALLVGLVSSGSTAAVSNEPRAPEAGGARRRWLVAASLVLLGLFAGQSARGMPLLLDAPRRTAAFTNLGGIDWDRPTPEDIGAYSGGMFGLLPFYMEGSGWRCSSVDPEDIGTAATEGIQLLVTINSPYVWSADQRAWLRSHLDGGGGLLVLGDHTDIFGVQAGFGSFLHDYGVHFEFDSAYPNHGNWTGDHDWGLGAPQLSRSARDVTVAIGASLSLSGPAFPVLWGRYSFSDLGMRANVPGSFLGNYDHDREERLGDLVVVAGAYSGRGAALVYGDTTAFQNGPLVNSYRSHVEPMLEWLSRPARVPRGPLRTLGGVLMIALALLCARLRGGALIARVAPFLIGMLFGALVPYPFAARTAWQPVGQSLLLLDTSHHPRLGDYGVEYNNPWPLSVAALRTGHLAVELDTWDAETLARADTLALIAPQRPFSREEQAQVRSFAERGGTVLAAASGRDATALNGLLSPMGVGFEEFNRGPVPPSRRHDPKIPRLLDASIVRRSDRPGDRVLFGSEREPYVLARPIGKGWVVLLGDTRVFSTENVEGTWGDWPGNVALLQWLLVEYARGDLSPRVPAFPPAREVDSFGVEEKPQ